MNLHEYQSKQVFNIYGLPVPNSQVVQSSADAVTAASVLGGDSWVVKAQVHAGGRGKAGGVKLVDNVESLTHTVGSLSLIHI